MIELIAVTGNYRIYSDFGTSVVEGTSSSSSGGPGVGITFYVEQINPVLTSAYWTIAPATGSYGDFWDNDSNIVGGSPATESDLGMFLSFGADGTERDSTSFFHPLVINADSFGEGDETFYFQVHHDHISAALGYTPSAQVQFTIVDDDGRFDPVGDVVITGSSMAGDTLWADTSRIEDGDGLGAFSFQWFSDGAVILGATSQEYLVQISDAGAEISVQISYIDGAGEREQLISAPTEPVSLGAVVETSSTISLRDFNQTTVSLILTGSADINGAGNGQDNTIRGNAGNNVLSGFWGNDGIFGGIGNDTLMGGEGNDTVIGGDGRDLIFLNQGDDVFHDNAQGGELGQDTVYAGFGNDTIQGGNGNDVFYGQAGNDLIHGRLGDDLIFGGGQFDTIHAGEGNDTVIGGDGRDLIFLNQGDDVFHDNAQGGELGQDTVYAGFGNDTLQGGNGNDVFYGQAGNDLIHGRLGDDLIFGGGQFDTIHAGEGNDTVIGGDGRDLIFLNQGDDVFHDNAQGGELGQDTVYAGFGNDTIQGGNGNDVFYGQAGNDLIHGRLGDDIVGGGNGNDTLDGGGGNDTLTGGIGADVFIFNSNDAGTDIVTDFLLGTDQFQLGGAGTATVNYNAGLNEASVIVAGDVVAILRSISDLSGFGVDDIAFV